MKNKITIDQCTFYKFRGRAVNNRCEGNYSNSFGLTTQCITKAKPLPILGRVLVTRVGCGFSFSWIAPTVGVEPGEESSLRYDI